MVTTTNNIVSLCSHCGERHHLAHLIDLYERNFRLLERLIPELELPYATAVSRCEQPAVYLTVVDRARYTSVLRLSHRFEKPDGWHSTPDFWVRVYRDVRVAEALRSARRASWSARDERDPAAQHYLHAQWQRNHMLMKWLQYLLARGHGFSMASRPRDAVPVLRQRAG